MNDIKFSDIETDRLILRKFRESDAWTDNKIYAINSTELIDL